jgi:hypothetical protein
MSGAAVDLFHDANLDGALYKSVERAIVDHAIVAAADLHGIRLTPEEEAAVESALDRVKAGQEHAAADVRTVLEAVIRIHQGEARSGIENELRRSGVEWPSLDQLLNEYPTLDDARRGLAIDWTTKAVASTRALERRNVLVRRLTTLVLQTARSRGIPVEEAEKAFWEEVLHKKHFQLLDSDYQMTDLRGVLNTHAPQNPSR